MLVRATIRAFSQVAARSCGSTASLGWRWRAVRWRWRADNPADDAEPGRIAKPHIKPPSETDVIRLLTAAEMNDGSLLTYLFLDAETGARRGELAALRLDDLHGDSVTVARALALGLVNDENLRVFEGHIWPSEHARGERLTALIEKDNPKSSNSVRILTLSPATLELLASQRQRLFDDALIAGVVYPANGFLFPAGLDGKRPLRPDTWSHRFIRLRDQLGLSAIRPQDLRHFVATTLLTSGVDLATVAGRLGHGTGGKTTLAIYSHFVRAPDTAASQVMAAVLKLRPPKPDGTGKVVAMRRRESPA